MPVVPSHLLKRAKTSSNNAAHFLKDSSSKHLMRELPVRVFTLTRSYLSGGREGEYITDYTSSPQNYSKTFGLAALRDSFDNNPSSSYTSSESPQTAYAVWGNRFFYGVYYGRWDAIAGCLAFSQPAATDSASTGRHRLLTHLKSVSFSVVSYHVPSGTGQARVAVILSSSSTRPSTLSSIQSAPYVPISGTGQYSLFLHATGMAYIYVVPYFEDLVPPDQDAYNLEMDINSNASAAFSLATSVTVEYETEDEAEAAISEEGEP